MLLHFNFCIEWFGKLEKKKGKNFSLLVAFGPALA
jgi:hypothetical protein